LFNGERWLKGQSVIVYKRLAAKLLLFVIFPLAVFIEVIHHNLAPKIFSIGVTALALSLCCYVVVKIFIKLITGYFNNIIEYAKEKSPEFNGNKAELLKAVIEEVIKEEKELKEELNELKNTVRNKYLYYFIKGMFNEGQFTDGLKKSSYTFDNPYFAVICIKLFFAKGEDCYTKDDSKLLKNTEMVKLCEELANMENKGAAFISEDDRIVIVLNLYSADGLDAFIDLLRDKITKVHDEGFYLGASNIYDVMSCLPKAFREGNEALEYQIIFDKREALRYKDIEQMDKTNYIYPISEEKQLINSVLSANREATFSALESIAESFAGHGLITYGRILQVYNQLLGTLVKELMVSGSYNNDLSYKSNDFFNNFHGKKTLKEVNLYINELCNEFIDYVIYQNNSMNRYCRQVVEYINEHYQQDVSISSVAERLNLSYPYLSKIFKENLKVNFNDYLNAKRIDESKKLLSNTEDSVYEIALKVGYNNDQSFTRFFKKFEGITPGDYRKKTGSYTEI